MSTSNGNGSTTAIEAAVEAKKEAVLNAAEVSNSTVAPENRKKKLVRKDSGPNPLKFQLWIGGHLACIGFGAISFVFQTLRLQNKWYINSISYRLSLIGAIVALMSTFSHKFGLTYWPSFSTLLAHQNFQYMILAGVWIITFKSIFKIIPYFLISLLQVASHKKIKPILSQAPFLASVIAYDELFLIVYLFLRTLLLRNTSGYQLTLFLVFYWLRILYNKETGNLFRALVDKLDGRLSQVKNPKVERIWSRAKELLDVKVHDSSITYNGQSEAPASEK